MRCYLAQGEQGVANTLLLEIEALTAQASTSLRKQYGAVNNEAHAVITSAEQEYAAADGFFRSAIDAVSRTKRYDRAVLWQEYAEMLHQWAERAGSEATAKRAHNALQQAIKLYRTIELEVRVQAAMGLLARWLDALITKEP